LSSRHVNFHPVPPSNFAANQLGKLKARTEDMVKTKAILGAGVLTISLLFSAVTGEYRDDLKDAVKN
jgi:hypothetical protein